MKNKNILSFFFFFFFFLGFVFLVGSSMETDNQRSPKNSDYYTYSKEPMINQNEENLTEEELRKFKPSLEVDQIEEAVYKEDLTDMQDIVKEVMAKKEKTVRR